MNSNLKYLKKIFIAVIVFFQILGYIPAEKLKTFHELHDSDFMEAEGERLYIADTPHVYIYTLPDVKLVKKFCRLGEGPGEIQNIFNFHVTEDGIFISDLARVHIFTRNGVFKDVVRTSAFCMYFTPMSNGFLMPDPQPKDGLNWMVLQIRDRQLKNPIPVLRYKSSFQYKGKINPIAVSCYASVYNDNVFVAIPKDGKIHCFDNKGNLLKTFDTGIEAIPFTSKDKKDFEKISQRSPQTKAVYQMHKNRYEYPDYFPKLKYFLVKDDKIYVVTNRKYESNYLWHIYDLDGDYLLSVVLPLDAMNGKKIETSNYAIHKGMLYQNIENTEKEVLELHRNPIAKYKVKLKNNKR
ncbi:MAG: hypothetical protein GY765_17415 [bacterium]|nr:hypothetical protein [bacterium]